MRAEQDGYSLVELLAVTVVLLVLASAVMPLAKVTVQRHARGRAAPVAARDAHRHRPLQGRRRSAADRRAPTSRPAPKAIRRSSRCWSRASAPTATPAGRKLKFLRRVPMDPMTRSHEWGMRSYQDDPDSTSWGGQNVYDVYTKSGGVALDGTKYARLVARAAARVGPTRRASGGWTLIELVDRDGDHHGPRLHRDDRRPQRGHDRRRRRRSRKTSSACATPSTSTTPTRASTRPTSRRSSADKYMRDVPVDPISNSRDTLADRSPPSPIRSNPSADPGIFNVKSGAEGTSLQGTAYSEF